MKPSLGAEGAAGVGVARTERKSDGGRNQQPAAARRKTTEAGKEEREAQPTKPDACADPAQLNKNLIL